MEPGRAGAYLALFGERGFALLVTTLIGALVGHWIDERLGTPIFVIIGFLAGAGLGARVMYQLINRFLARIEQGN
jgi:F0F1-type ATP synthase assembly protein I